MYVAISAPGLSILIFPRNSFPDTPGQRIYIQGNQEIIKGAQFHPFDGKIHMIGVVEDDNFGHGIDGFDWPDQCQ